MDCCWNKCLVYSRSLPFFNCSNSSSASCFPLVGRPNQAALSSPPPPINNNLNHSFFSSLNPSCTTITTTKQTNQTFICRARKARKYKFPDPIPEFADAETKKFKEHLLVTLSAKKDVFGEGDLAEQAVEVCIEIFSTFLHKEYGGPGTLLITPFMDMADSVKEAELPGGAEAATAALRWAREHVDKDWKEWNARN
ncbi:hypothetical protein Tsubulata_019382 [Turnera subulata]|uniref:Uncharacterized protein n=1 Tax=Turnera subulata TaxID=218843 RepID=A0A9Q0JEI1_9ROSI|nr:hypothetical protein Tsubulata_019382 [Turnera subulata]